MNYYSKVVFDFLNYREYKQRCEYIEKTTNDIPSWVVRRLADRGMSIDYSKNRVQTSNLFDPTSSAVIDAVEDNYSEYVEKMKLVERVEMACKGLNPVEEYIMKKKYMSGYIIKDYQVYTGFEFTFGRSKYYKFKDEAIKKAARIMGYLKKT